MVIIVLMVIIVHMVLIVPIVLYRYSLNSESKN